MGAAPFPSITGPGPAPENSAGQGLCRHLPGGLFSRPHPAPRLCSPELPAQLLEEKANGEEAQSGRGGEDTRPVILQVPPQAAGEGLSDKRTERMRRGTGTASPGLEGSLVLGKGSISQRAPEVPPRTQPSGKLGPSPLQILSLSRDQPHQETGK